MSVNSLSNVGYSPKTVSKYPREHLIVMTPDGKKMELPMEYKKDVFQASSGFSENLVKKYHKTSLLKGYHTMEGSVNNKAVSLNIDSKRTGLMSSKKTYSGIFGEEKAEIVVDKNNVAGIVGNKEINLSIKRGLLAGDFSIVGNIGDKEINIQKGSQIGSAQGENDIITLCASLAGHRIKVKNGEFTSLRDSVQKQRQETEDLIMAGVIG